jgi:hypothetical protein
MLEDEVFQRSANGNLVKPRFHNCAADTEEARAPVPGPTELPERIRPVPQNAGYVRDRFDVVDDRGTSEEAD